MKFLYNGLTVESVSEEESSNFMLSMGLGVNYPGLMVVKNSETGEEMLAEIGELMRLK